MKSSIIILPLFHLVVVFQDICNAQLGPGWTEWSSWNECTQSCREFRYRTCNYNLFGEDACEGYSADTHQGVDCPFAIGSIGEFHRGVESANRTFQEVCTDRVLLSGTHLDINFCYESYGSVNVGASIELPIRETIPVKFSIPDAEGSELCSVSLAWNFVYDKWIDNIKGTDKNGNSFSGDYVQGSKFFTVMPSSGYKFDSIDLHFSKSVIRPQTLILDDSCNQANISNEAICAYIDETDSFSSIGCEMLPATSSSTNFTNEDFICRCPFADNHVVLLKAIPPKNLGKAEMVISLIGSITTAVLSICSIFRKTSDITVELKGNNVLKNILTSIFCACVSLAADESIEYFRDTGRQDLLAQSLAFSLIAFNAWMAIFALSQGFEMTEWRTCLYPVFGWTIPALYVFGTGYIKEYSTYDYRHWPNVDNAAIWTVFGAVLFGTVLSILFVFCWREKWTHEVKGTTLFKKYHRIWAFLTVLLVVNAKWMFGMFTVKCEVCQLIFAILMCVQFFIASGLLLRYFRNKKEDKDTKKNNDQTGTELKVATITPAV